MTSTAATYYYNDRGQGATVSLQTHRLSIEIQQEGRLTEVLWYYDQIALGAEGRFSYPGPARQELHIPSTEFARALGERIRQQRTSVSRHRSATLLQVLVAMLAFALVFYFLIIPRIAVGLADRVSVQYEHQLGEQMYRTLEASFQVDEPRTALINEFFREMEVPSAFPVQITVVQEEVTNAFAMPGGRIVVYEGLLRGISTYPELAALLAHEYIHVQNRHTLRSLLRQFSSRLFLSLLLGQVDVAGGVLLQNVDQLKDLSYSRRLETEADEEGARLLAERGIDCGGFVRLFQLLQKESAGQNIPEFVNSHPNLDKRIRHIRQQDFCRQNQVVPNERLHGLFLQLKTAE